MLQHKYFLVLDYVRNDFKAVLKYMSNVNKTIKKKKLHTKILNFQLSKMKYSRALPNG